MCTTEKDTYSSCNNTNQTRSYFWIKDRKKTIHIDLFTDELGFKKERENVRTWLDTFPADKSLLHNNNSFYLGHLDHIGKLRQTGNGDHIMVGFQLGPGDVIKQSVRFLSHKK